MSKLTNKEQKFKEFILKENKYSTDISAKLFWANNPYTIQPYMKENKITFQMLENVLNVIESEKKATKEQFKNANCFNIEDLECEEFNPYTEL